MDIAKQFVTDPTAETEGVWHPYGAVQFLVARMPNPKYQKLITQLVATNKRVLDQKNEVADKLSEKLMVDAMARCILLGWGPLPPENPGDPVEAVTFEGEPVDYSVDNAIRFLQIKDFRSLIVGWATDMESYRLEAIEEKRKN